MQPAAICAKTRIGQIGADVDTEHDWELAKTFVDEVDSNVPVQERPREIQQESRIRFASADDIERRAGRRPAGEKETVPGCFGEPSKVRGNTRPVRSRLDDGNADMRVVGER
jgi:hypothetical protein